MSHEMNRKVYYNRDPRNRDPRYRDREWDRGRSDYRGRPPPRRSRSPPRHDIEKRRSRSPRKNDKDALDENILSEISKLPEPSELWDNQFQDAPYPPPSAPAPPSFQHEYGSSYQPSYSGIYSDFPTPAAPIPPEMAQWNQMSLPPPPTPNPPQPFVNPEEQLKKEAAIESEMRHQKAALSKQREDYIKKATILKKELDTLKDQRTELRGDSKRSPSPDTKRFLKENTKLQLEIQNKLKTITNVVDMLNGIIGEDAPMPDVGDSDDSTELSSKRKSRSPSSNRKFNYVYYDPEMHWCRVCNEFPPTAKDYLNHLHSAAHQKMAAAHMEAPWHSVSGANEGFPSLPSAPTKRTPIRGLQFFVPSTAWYCKLCDQFIGDLHCASAHLKSVVHSNNYTNFVEQNPHWETDWMSDRQKAFEKVRAKAKPAAEVKPQYAAHTITFNKDGIVKRAKETSPPAEMKKKKKEKEKKAKKKKRDSSSSSSSDSDSSDSEPAKKKKKKKEKQHNSSASDEKALAEWMSAIQGDRLNDTDRRLIDTLRARMKIEKAAEEKARSPPPEQERSQPTARKRESEHRDSRSREIRDRENRERERDRERERERDREQRDRERDRERRRSPPRADVKKPEIRKMPFIGKMPVYKSLNKTKTEDQKKEDDKKKEEEEAMKKRREEMDAEIQKKVAEFKEKIALAGLDRAVIPPPAVALPTALGELTTPLLTLQRVANQAPPPAPPVPPAPQQPPPPSATPSLPKDFQEALDIIFPTGDSKPDLPTPDMFGLPPGFPMGLGGVMPPFPPFLQPQMPPQMSQMNLMNMSFDMNNMNNSLFQQTRPQQLFDKLLQNSKPNNKSKFFNNNKSKGGYQGKKPYVKPQNKPSSQSSSAKVETKVVPKKENGEAARKKEEMEDLAMLGIDASDVGAGIE